MRSAVLSAFFIVCVSPGLLSAQPVVSCGTTSVPPVVRAEGLSERVADVVYVCSGNPNLPITGNFTITLNTEISNRLSSGGLVTGIVFTIDSGSGPAPVLIQPYLSSSNTLVYTAVPISMPAQGSVTIRIAGIRANATRVPPGQQIIATLALNGASLMGSTVMLPVGTPQRALYAGFTADLVCAQRGSPLPDQITFSNLIDTHTAFSSIRFTEGFGDASGTRSAPAYLNADSGQRVIVHYSGFPSDARLFVPDVIAGSDAITATSGGDFGLPVSGGKYAPTSEGSLLLARVAGASSIGVGGSPVYSPGAAGSVPVTFDSISELQIAGGTFYAVYEVVDANPSRLESAQFPTFLGLLPNGNRVASTTGSHIYLAPTSTITAASATEAIPRFIATDPPPDCSLVGDCATYLPQLTVRSTEIDLTAGSTSTQDGFFSVQNTGGGAMQWTTGVTYTNGSGWLTLQPSQGTNNTTVLVYGQPQNLAPGTYRATITIDGGQYTTPKAIPVIFVVPAPVAAPPPVPIITDVVNAASFAAVPVVPGSLTTITGSALSGKSVSATFNNLPATILYNDGKQLNLLVPSGLPSTGTAQFVVTADGVASRPRTVTLGAFAPAIFAGAALNQDASLNSISNPAAPASIVVVFATGLSGGGQISARIHDQDIDVPYYAGPAPGFQGVQQVNVQIPQGLSGLTTDLSVCGAPDSSSAKICSTPIQLSIK
jgi:uncharacterized protein (TIGR03437 family)